MDAPEDDARVDPVALAYVVAYIGRARHLAAKPAPPRIRSTLVATLVADELDPWPEDPTGGN